MRKIESTKKFTIIALTILNITVKNPEWSKLKIAEAYDYGRPLPESIVLKAAKNIEQQTGISFVSKQLLDAGCGTGRVTLPLAIHNKSLQIVGVDRSKEMLHVLKRIIVEKEIGNYAVQDGDLLRLQFSDNKFDLSLVSSVLHAIPQWQRAVEEIVRVTKNLGHLLLVSEQSDLYDLGLERKKSKNNNLFEKFWGKYIALRHKYNLPGTEASQVGIRWQLGYPEVIDYLRERNYLGELKDITINWENIFSIKDLLKILEERAWSSMFTADDATYNALLKDMRGWLKHEDIGLDQECSVQNVFKCEVVKIQKKEHTH